MSASTIDFLNRFDEQEYSDMLIRIVTGSIAGGAEAAAASPGAGTSRTTRAKRQRLSEAAQKDTGSAAKHRVLCEVHGHKIILHQASEWMRARLSAARSQVGVGVNGGDRRAWSGAARLVLPSTALNTQTHTHSGLHHLTIFTVQPWCGAADSG